MWLTNLQHEIVLGMGLRESSSLQTGLESAPLSNEPGRKTCMLRLHDRFLRSQ